MRSPLADRMRPTDIKDVVGQKHLLGDDKLLKRIIKKGETIPNMIFYGPSGVGKTTVANIISKNTGKTLYKLNATSASTADIKEIIASLDTFMNTNGVLLYLDEIQHFNKKQQQSLLEFIEDGRITLIASTTENPYFYIYNALLSRSVVFEFLPLDSEDIKKALWRAVSILQKDDYKNIEILIDDKAIEHIAKTCTGDVRKALNVLEISLLGAEIDKDSKLIVTEEIVSQATQRKVLRYDKSDDNHYDLLSAFQKSIRGSDPDASIHYLARLLEGGDIKSAIRRLLVIASEDISLAYPNAIVITKACCDSALQLGLPEAQLPLAQATILLATAPKSNSTAEAIWEAVKDINKEDTGEIPKTLKDTHYSGSSALGNGGYVYPHTFENHWINQQYLPDKIKDKVYYTFGDNKNEQSAKKYWQDIKKEFFK